MKITGLPLFMATALAAGFALPALAGALPVALGHVRASSTAQGTVLDTNVAADAQGNYPVSFQDFNGGDVSSFEATGSPGSALSYSLGVVNPTSSEETFSFEFSAPIPAILGQSKVMATLEGMLRAAGAAGAMLKPLMGGFQTGYAVDGHAPAALPVSLGGVLGTDGVRWYGYELSLRGLLRGVRARSHGAHRPGARPIGFARAVHLERGRRVLGQWLPRVGPSANGGSGPGARDLGHYSRWLGAACPATPLPGVNG